MRIRGRNIRTGFSSLQPLIGICNQTPATTTGENENILKMEALPDSVPTDIAIDFLIKKETFSATERIIKQIKYF
jgi:hypothetical protein